MSSRSSTDNSFLFAIQTAGNKRSTRELKIIYGFLRQIEAFKGLRERYVHDLCKVVRYEFHQSKEILYKKDDPCRCYYILISGSVFLNGTMLFPFQSFGKQIPSTKRRSYQCVVLEPSEMLAVDYPDMAIHPGEETGKRPHALRRRASLQHALNDVIEADTSSSEQGSPLHRQSANGQATIIQNDNESQHSFPKDTDDDDYADEEDSISLHSNSSFIIKDLVIDVLKKEIDDRNDDDIEVLMEFTKSLRAFSNMTEPIRRSLCKLMVFAYVEHAEFVMLRDGETLDSWTVIINGQVKAKIGDDERILTMGDSFGVKPSLQTQKQKGTMTTVCDDCQFLVIAQQDYFSVLHQGQENIENITNDKGEIIMVKEKRVFENGTKRGNIAIRGTAESLMEHMLEENAVDTTYIEDFLLTYRVFDDEPLKMCQKLLEWFEVSMFRNKVIRIILLWVNNHFKDFESDWKMMALLEKFHEKLNQCNLQGQTMLFNIACKAKAKPRVVTINRSSGDIELGFTIIGGADSCEHKNPIFVATVVPGSIAEEKGVKRGDQILDVNGQNFEKLLLEKAQAILKKNTNLSITLKTNLFAFKEQLYALENPSPKVNKNLLSPNDSRAYTMRPQRPSIASSSSQEEIHESLNKTKKGGTLGRATRKLGRLFKKESNSFADYLVQHADTFGYDERGYTTIDSSSPRRGGASRQAATLSHTSSPEIVERGNFDFFTASEMPDDVIKVFRADQSFRLILISKDTTAGDAVRKACKEFAISESTKDFALYKVTAQTEEFVKQSKLPEPLSKLADIPLGSRYYLKNTMNSEQLLPDENIPELLKEGIFTFLDLSCYEVALYLTREDYKLFQTTEPSNFIDDLFQRDTGLEKFKDFEAAQYASLFLPSDGARNVERHAYYRVFNQQESRPELVCEISIKKDLVNRELFWVVTTICSEPNVVQRAKIIKHFIKIAHHCKTLQNYNSTFAIVSGLGYRAVSKMKQTWEKVSLRSVRLFQELQALMDPSRNMSKYRTLLNEAVQQPPVIPYIPVVKKDLTFLHLGNDSRVEGLINFEKMRMISKEIRNVCRLCIPDVSQILPVEMGALKDAEKPGLYQTLGKKGRRGSLNNARRMYDKNVNIRKVRQYMTQIVVITDEEKLMDMSKQVEFQQAQRRSTTAALAESPSRPPKNSHGTLHRNDSTGSSGSFQSRSTFELQYLQGIEPIQPRTPTKKKTPLSTIPMHIVDEHAQQMIDDKLIMVDGKGRHKKRVEAKRSVSIGSGERTPDPSPVLSRKQHNSLKEADNNNVIGFENLNLNNNRHDRASSASCTSLDSIPELLTENNIKRFSSNTNSGISSGRGSLASSTSLGAVYTSSPSILSLCAGGSPRSSPVAWETAKAQSNTAPPNLMTLQQKPPVSPSRFSSGSSTETLKSGSNRQYRDRPVIKQTGRRSSYGNAGMMQINRNEKIRHQISSSTSSPALNANDFQSSLLPNHPRIFRTASADSGLGAIDESDSINRDPTTDHPHAPPPTRRNLPPLPTDRRQLLMSSSEESDASVTGADAKMLLHRAYSTDPQSFLAFSGFQVDGSESDQAVVRSEWPVGKSAVKGIHDFVAGEQQVTSKQRAMKSMISRSNMNPVMQPNFIRNIRSSAPQDIEELLLLELQQQKLSQQPTLPRRAPISQHPEEPGQSVSFLHPALVEQNDPRAKEYIKWLYSHPNSSNANSLRNYENYQNGHSDPKRYRDYVNVMLPPRSGAPLPPPPLPVGARSVTRQQAVDQQWSHEHNWQGCGDLCSSQLEYDPDEHYMNADVIRDNPPPPPKRTTSIGRPLQLRQSMDSSSVDSPLSPLSSARLHSPSQISESIERTTRGTSSQTNGYYTPRYRSHTTLPSPSGPNEPRTLPPYDEKLRHLTRQDVKAGVDNLYVIEATNEEATKV